MYYLVDMYDNKLNFINNIGNETCKEALDAYNSVKEVLEFYTLGKCVSDAWNALMQWSNEADRSGNSIMRNMHTAERLVRGFLFELRTCLDHMETEIKRAYGKDSALLKVFERGTSNAYDTHPEYGFTYHLRNCSQHCKNVVHGFNGATGIGISSSAEKLLAEYEKWKDTDKDYMTASGGEIDLLKTFSVAFTAFNDALAPVIQYLLNTDNAGNQLVYLRNLGDALHTGLHHDMNCYHVVSMQFRDGKEATKEDMGRDGIVISAYPFDWETIYELTDAVTKLNTEEHLHDK